jgi:6,7-dimethyl-8-ribityllumazine synthase
VSESSWPGADRLGELGLSGEEPALPPTVQPGAAPPAPEPAPAFDPAPAFAAPAAVVDEASAQEAEDTGADTMLEAPPEDAAVPVAEPPAPAAPQHAGGELDIPAGVGILQGEPNGSRRAVALVVARFNGDITTRMLKAAIDELDIRGVARSAVTVMPVPGAFELPIAAMALAKTRRFACVVALGCVIRGETAHFDFVASEAASGLQLAALETGVPVAFAVLTTDTVAQAEARIPRVAENVRGALEMADAFSKLRTAVAG